jgi:magnesium-transporting ATPase (P-type)
VRQADDGTWTVEGDAMEGALVALASRAGLDVEALRLDWHRLDEVPFDAVHRFMATLHRPADALAVVFVKGAPEQVLTMCVDQQGPKACSRWTPPTGCSRSTPWPPGATACWAWPAAPRHAAQTAWTWTM